MRFLIGTFNGKLLFSLMTISKYSLIDMSQLLRNQTYTKNLDLSIMTFLCLTRFFPI